MTNALDLPKRSMAVAQRIVELRAHWETNSPALVTIMGDCIVRIVHVGHDTVTVDCGAGERRTLPAMDVGVLP